MNDDYKHVVSKRTDKIGNTFWYCHMKAFPNMPVFGSIGSYSKAKAICDEFNTALRNQMAREGTRT